jgi:hypothetical protein
MIADGIKDLPGQIAEEDWFSRGKADALMGYSKQLPETKPEFWLLAPLPARPQRPS